MTISCPFCEGNIEVRFETEDSGGALNAYGAYVRAWAGVAEIEAEPGPCGCECEATEDWRKVVEEAALAALDDEDPPGDY